MDADAAHEHIVLALPQVYGSGTDLSVPTHDEVESHARHAQEQEARLLPPAGCTQHALGRGHVGQAAVAHAHIVESLRGHGLPPEALAGSRPVAAYGRAICILSTTSRRVPSTAGLGR